MRKASWLAAAVVLAWPCAAQAGECGEAGTLAGLYRKAVLATEAGARGRLSAALMPVTECLSRGGGLPAVEGLKGRYVPLLRALSGLSGTKVQVRGEQELEDAVRLWKMRGRSR